ncbi:MAG: NADH-quinone oxidoreductase subunit NuoE family protein [Candidatus Kariarchaeaceae archaeon]|jgi:NADH:ubiquinone oxidoreductase subunit E
MQTLSPTIALIEKYDFKPSALIQILSELHEIHDYLPLEEIKIISEKLGISLSKIYGVISFYAHFKLDKPGKHKVTVCSGTACFVKNATMLLDVLDFEFDIQDGKTTEDGLFSMESVTCLGCCALAPVVKMDDQVHGEMDLKKIRRLIKQTKRLEGQNV